MFENGVQLRDDGLQEVNQLRRQYWLHELRHSDTLSWWAGEHAAHLGELCKSRGHWHLRPEEVHDLKYLDGQGENVALLPIPPTLPLIDSVRRAVQHLTSSPCHLHMMLSPEWQTQGVGTHIERFHRCCLLILVQRFGYY